VFSSKLRLRIDDVVFIPLTDYGLWMSVNCREAIDFVRSSCGNLHGCTSAHAASVCLSAECETLSCLCGACRRTNIYINPPVAPPLGGYGYGSPFFGGYGYGWSPFSFFAPGPSVAVGVGGGFDTLVLFLVLGAVVGAVRRFLNRNNDDYDDY
jgi:hypothetical protein